MIKIVENDTITVMSEYCAGDPYGCRIMATYLTYGIGESFAQFWLQYDEKNNVTAVIGSLDNGLTVCAKGEYDCEEIDAFVKMLAGETGALRPVRDGEIADGLLLRLDRTLITPFSGDIEINPNGEDLYSVLECCPGQGFDVPPFSAFYDDMKRRVRAKTAVTALLRFDLMPVSCAAVHRCGNTSLLTMCATVPEFRGKGCGANCTRALISKLPDDTDMYAFALPGLCSYYEKMGFRVVGGFKY